MIKYWREKNFTSSVFPDRITVEPTRMKYLWPQIPPLEKPIKEEVNE